MTLSKIAAALVASAALVACGPSGGGNHPPGTDPDGGTNPPPGAHLEIAPGQVTLTVAGGVAQTQVYTIEAVGADGTRTDVSSETQLSLGLPGIGSFTGNVLTTAPDRGGHTLVTAEWHGLQATSDLTVLLRSVIVEPGAPPDAPDRFGGASPGGAPPELVYPDNGVLVPPNLNTMEFHFRPGSGQDLFELTFTGSNLQLAVYLTCTPLGGGCVWSPTQDTWDVLATAGRGDAPLRYTLRGLDQGTSQVGASTERSIQYASDDVTGGIYYWAAAAGQIMRYDFGLRGQNAEHFLDPAKVGALTCVGCHTLSRDGSKIAVGLDIPGPAGLETLTVSSRTKDWSAGGFTGGDLGAGANFFSFSPDDARLVSSTGTNLEVRSATDGTGMTTVVQNATMPDWSPDGGRVVFARAGQASIGANPGVSKGSIVQVDTTTWQGEQVLVSSAGENNYYPSYSPDGSWVLFDRCAGTDSYDQMDARLWVVSAQGGDPIQLATASPAPGGDSWPKWSPVAHSYLGGQVFWLTFSSRRAYGLRGGGTSQLWMVGFDPARAAVGLDPSFTAFWLPFQDPSSGNHIAQWAEHVDRTPCSDGCASDETCDPDGYCVPVVN